MVALDTQLPNRRAGTLSFPMVTWVVRHLVGSGVRTLYLPNVSVEVKGTNPAVLPRSLSG